MTTQLKTEVSASIDQVRALAGTNVRKVIIAGEPFFASLTNASTAGFIKQPNRDATLGLLEQFKKHAPKVMVAADERLFSFPRVRFAFAFDGYLAWGLREKRKGVTILFGGGETDTAVSIQIMVFADGRLTEVKEKALPSRSATYFHDSLRAAIDELKVAWPTARMVQAAPLTDWGQEDVQFIGNLPLRNLKFRHLVQKVTKRSLYALPIALTTAGLVIYPAMVAKGWSAYSGAVAAYEKEIADPAIMAKGGLDTAYLDTMNARRLYMEQPRRQTALADKSAKIVQGIASIAGVRIVEIKLPAPGSMPGALSGLTVAPSQVPATPRTTNKDSSPDVWMSLSVPVTSDPAIVQAKTVLMQVADATGMTLRITAQAWREVAGRRVFDIEGFVHD